MATYTGAFELRRLLVKIGRGPSGGTQEDQSMFSFHFAKLTSGAPDANWLTADYTAVEGRFDTWWASMKIYYPNFFTLQEYRWFKDGPAWSPDDLAPGPPNPAERVTARSIAGTGGTGQALPPEVAVTLTEKVPILKRWGTVYLPAPLVIGETTTEGRIATSLITSWLGFAVTLYNGCRADGKQPVVWSRGRSAYTTSRGNAIAAHAASAYSIDSLQMDNLFDVVRSRRYDGPTLRSVTVLT